MMKPYTLEWWLVQFDEAKARSAWAFKAGELLDTDRYDDIGKRLIRLARWIRERIIDKYGENETG